MLSTSSTVLSKEKSVDERFFHVFLDASANPEKVCPGDEMTFSATIFDFFGIEKVEAKIEHEKGYDIIEMSKTSGLNRYGTWEAKWVVHDTKVKEYSTIITAYSKSGFSYSKEVTWFDPVEDDWWDTDWNYRKQISISDSVSDYQMKIEVGYNDAASSYDVHCEGNCNNNFSDIRFTAADGTTSCSYWIEEKTDGDDCTIWVNSSGDSTMYIYYGNSNVGNQSDGDSTFLFFDDFDDGSVDSNKWTNNGMTESGGVVSGDTTISDYLFGKVRINIDTSTTFRIRNHATGSTSARPGVLQTNGNPYSIRGFGWQDYSNGNRYTDTRTNSVNQKQHAAYDTNWHIYEGQWTTGRVDFYLDGALLTSHTSRVPSGSDVLYAQLEGDADYDYFYVRKFTSTEPSWDSFGSEEIALPTEPTLNTPENNSHIKNTKPTFNWSSSENAQNYTLLVDNETDLTDGDEWINYSFDSTTTQNTTPDAKELTEGTWYWKVIANNSNGQNTSERWKFILDTTAPEQVNLSSPADSNSTDSNTITLRWNITSDNAGGSGIDHYQIQIASDSSFTQIITNDNSTTTNYTTKTIPEGDAGVIYWRVRAWDQSGNNGTWSDNRSITILNFFLNVSTNSFNILKGNSQLINIEIGLDYGVAENITLSAGWSEALSDVTTSFSTTKDDNSSWTSVLTIEVGADAPTEFYTCYVNATSDSGVTKSESITVDINSMTFLVLADPTSLTLNRDDSATTSLSVEFLTGGKQTASLSGSWQGTAPSGVSASISTTSGTPTYSSTVTFTTSKTASSGSYTYRLVGSGGGMSRTVDIDLEINTDLVITLETDEDSYEKGQKIQISGTAKDPNGDNVGSGTATITISSGNWTDTRTASISQGIYSTEYYITFDKPIGTYTISATATDSHGHATQNTPNTQVQVSEPGNYEQYSMDIISPTTGQLYKRGETVTFTISLENQDQEKIQGATVQAILNNGQTIKLTGGTGGIYSASYDIGYDSTTGNISAYIEAKKEEDEKLKMGFDYVEFKIQSIKPTIEILEPSAGQMVESGENILIKIKAVYPDGTHVQEGVLKAIGPDGKNLVFTKTQEAGIFTATYVATTEDIGNWNMNIQIQDAYGNTATLNGGDIDIVQSKLTTNMIRYWYVTLTIITTIILLAIYIINKKLRQIKNNNLKNQIQQIKTLKQKNAVLYFSKGELTRETYDKLTQEYENKIAKLSKKQRLLEKKINRNKKIGKKSGEENEN